MKKTITIIAISATIESSGGGGGGHFIFGT